MVAPQRILYLIMFITFEGIEGSGKTTQIQKIGAFFKGKGRNCIITREPGGTAIGVKIRAVLLDPQNQEIDPLTEVLLYTADRAQHLRQVVIPALEQGKIVLCDRFLDATIVYQGYARGIDVDMIQTAHRLFLNDLKPDLTILLDLSPETGLARAWRQVEQGGRTGMETRFEQETLSFHEKVREGYLHQAYLEPSRFCIVDASRDEERVGSDILEIISFRLPDKRFREKL